MTIEALAAVFDDGESIIAAILDVFDVALWGRECVACSLRPADDFELGSGAPTGDLCHVCHLEALPIPAPPLARPARPEIIALPDYSGVQKSALPTPDPECVDEVQR